MEVPKNVSPHAIFLLLLFYLPEINAAEVLSFLFFLFHSLKMENVGEEKRRRVGAGRFGSSADGDRKNFDRAKLDEFTPNTL